MNLRNVTGFLWLILVLTAVVAQDVAQPPASKQEAKLVQSQIREQLLGVYKGDVDTVLKNTHPKVIDMMGGPAKAREIMEKVLAKMVAMSMKIEDLKFPSEPVFLTGKENQFVIVPTKMIIAVGEKRIESLNYQFGARRIGGTKWGYIEGSRVNRDNVAKWFPDFPNDQKFPETYRKLIK